jgi:hypothetical protein
MGRNDLRIIGPASVSMKLKNYFIKKFPTHFCIEMKVPSDSVLEGDKKIIF